LREWNSTQPPSRVKPYFQGLSRLSTWLSALPLALSMEAHYREQILSGKAKLHVLLIKLHNRSNNKQKEESSS
ncbi:hypothetical protein, partial [Aeromonas sp. HMWF015]|uniref:hypothetical protein n=1 Tax=Aeromonas sp. HMWF015 TaxID=2056851 RepID=UPI001C62E61D